jgi:hypothetical protein
MGKFFKVKIFIFLIIIKKNKEKYLNKFIISIYFQKIINKKKTHIFQYS